MSNPYELKPGDHIEIKYRILQAECRQVRDRWIAAEVRSVGGGSWPLARLADGQFTEVRRYMEWRFCPN